MKCGIDSDRGTVMMAITMAVMLVTVMVVVVTVMMMEKLTLVITEDTCPLSVCDPWVCISSWFLGLQKWSTPSCLSKSTAFTFPGLSILTHNKTFVLNYECLLAKARLIISWAVYQC